MKAYRLHQVSDLRCEEVEIPKMDEESVLIKVCAAGICGSDIPRTYQTGAHKMPLILGHEFAGEVVETGSKLLEKWKGKRVGIFPLVPCMECRQCQNKQYEMCDHYDYLGSRSDGGFAEYVRVPTWNLIELPDQVTMEQAAMLEPMAVARHAIKKTRVSSTDRIAVVGLGTIGLFLVMLLKSMGCSHIWVAGNKDFQKEKILELGISAENFCDTRKEDFVKWIEEKTDGALVDVFFECVGKKEVMNQGILALAANGRLMLVGNPASDMDLPRDIYWKILRRQLTLLGTWNSSFTHAQDDDWHEVIRLLADGNIHPERFITHKYDLEHFMEGFQIMHEKKEDYVKIMLKLEDK